MMPMSPYRASKLADNLKTIAEATRLQVLQHLIDGPKVVSDLSYELNIPFVNVSHHLSVLYRDGMVVRTRTGRTVEYSLKPGVFVADPGGEFIGTFTVGMNKIRIHRDFAMADDRSATAVTVGV
jgi:DNA-binding transcriptional ArsR family regulator